MNSRESVRLSSPRTKENRFEKGEEMNPSDEEIPEMVHYREKKVTERSLMHYDFLSKYYFWIYLSIALVFGIVVAMMYQNNSGVLSSLASRTRFFNPSVLGILILIALIIISYATFQADMYCGNDALRILSNSFFMIFLFAFLLWSYFIFTTHQFQYAFWVSIVLLVIAVVWFLWLWKIDRLSSYFMIYTVLLFLYLSYATNQLGKKL